MLNEENKGTTLTSDKIWEWHSKQAVVGRTGRYAAKTGLPERLPDECQHPEIGLMIIDGRIECYLCGCRPTGLCLIDK